ncbi:MAG: Cof-type HAD-IIB family hydrolase [Erysipelotrichaceae bacterium]|nr:Cof-type HAD-IIB family hydrolase [Erysipelotrichaceae bacterium]
MNKINAVFFDIDGTIYDGEHGEIPLSAIHGLQALQDKKIKIFLATGRSLPAVQASRLDDVIRWDGYVCSNGACLHAQDFQVLWSSAFQHNQLEHLFRLTEHYQVGLVLQSADEVFAPFGISEVMTEAYRFFHNPVPVESPYTKQTVTMALAFQQKGFDFHCLEAVRGLTAIPGKANYADLIQTGITKSTGIQQIRELLKLTDGAWMAFGDADNDLEMLQAANIGVAMGNATCLIKEKADYITTGIQENGIYNALRHFGLI